MTWGWPPDSQPSTPFVFKGASSRPGTGPVPLPLSMLCPPSEGRLRPTITAGPPVFINAGGDTWPTMFVCLVQLVPRPPLLLLRSAHGSLLVCGALEPNPGPGRIAIWAPLYILLVSSPPPPGATGKVRAEDTTPEGRRYGTPPLLLGAARRCPGPVSAAGPCC